MTKFDSIIKDYKEKHSDIFHSASKVDTKKPTVTVSEPDSPSIDTDSHTTPSKPSVDFFEGWIGGSYSTPQATTYSSDIDSRLTDRIKGFIQLAKQEGINLRITSGYRETPQGTAGDRSHHLKGDAIDIGADDGILEAIVRNQNLREYLTANGLGIYDETTPEALAKTGGTGAHYHIGPDNVALAGLQTILTKYGIV